MEESDAAESLHETLGEERDTDERLTEIAESTVNLEGEEEESSSR